MKTETTEYKTKDQFIIGRYILPLHLVTQVSERAYEIDKIVVFEYCDIVCYTRTKYDVKRECMDDGAKIIFGVYIPPNIRFSYCMFYEHTPYRNTWPIPPGWDPSKPYEGVEEAYEKIYKQGGEYFDFLKKTK